MIANWTLPELFSDSPDTATPTLTEYFGTYTGRHFERLYGGGDVGGSRNFITPMDLVAVGMLGVNIAGDAAVAVLDTCAERISKHLADIPADVDLAAADDEIIGEHSPAWQLWRLLRSDDVPGVGRTKASKLMARKRPRLIPVQDIDVCDELGHPRKADFWATLRGQLTTHECGDNLHLGQWLHTARESSGIGEDISILRIFDVLVWMERHRAKTLDRAGEAAGTVAN